MNSTEVNVVETTIQKLKYVAMAAETIPDLTNVINRFADEGYGFVSLQAYEIHEAVEAGWVYGNAFVAIMKLKEDPAKDYEGAVDLINVDLAGSDGELAAKLAGGWEIIATYAKHATLIKKKEEAEVK